VPARDGGGAVYPGAVARAGTSESHSSQPGGGQLIAGDQARISNDGHIEHRARIDPAAIALWRQHRLVFRDDSLEDIAAQFNRYNENTRIIIQGDAVRTRRYTAVFDADDPMSLVTFLQGEGDLALESRDGELVIRAKAR
jgi:transmembrane sensor